jgi:benzoyl-CoA reductase/2-hydroxyglutaryl-CoA dehydratase subunit BcrC/BadD/HgdB
LQYETFFQFVHNLGLYAVLKETVIYLKKGVMMSDSPLSETGRQKFSRKPVIGCFPLYPPVEIFSAMGLVPVVLWNLKKEIENLELTDRHVQNYACGIARELMQFVLSDKGSGIDGMFTYNACDTLRNFPEIIGNHFRKSGRSLPMFRMHVPQANRFHTDPYRYLKHEITQLIEEVEWAFDVDFFRAAFEQTAGKYASMRTLCLEAETRVAKGAISFSAFSSTVLSCYALPIDDQIASLGSLISHAATDEPVTQSDILISGIMPPPLPVIRAMENAGLRIVANDIASLRRSYGYIPAATDDPVEYYTDYFALKFPCTTLLYQADARMAAFMELIESSGAKGVVLSGEKFCEYEYFEFPFLEQKLKEKGIPVLRLEFGVDDNQNIGSYTTRIEAFAELLSTT